MPMNLDADAPPADLSPPLQALWWLKKGGLATGRNGRRRTRSASRPRAPRPVTGCTRSRTGSRAIAAIPTTGIAAQRRNALAADPQADWERQVADLGG